MTGNPEAIPKYGLPTIWELLCRSLFALVPFLQNLPRCARSIFFASTISIRMVPPLEAIMASLSLRIRPTLLAGFCFLLVSPVCVGASSDDARLKSLYDGRRWFELRDSVAKGGASVFYQGVVACAFNDARRCEKKLGVIIRSHPKSDEAIEAHRRLASLYLTHGKYREALAQVDAVLALRTDDSDARDIRPLLAKLSESPDQETVRRTRTTLEIHEDGLPFSIRGVQATYWFDTGANYSILSESEAKRFGLIVRAMPTRVSVSTGARVDFRIAVADELSIGSMRLKNVAFLVFPDDQPPFNQAAARLTRTYRNTGAVGF